MGYAAGCCIAFNSQISRRGEQAGEGRIGGAAGSGFIDAYERTKLAHVVVFNPCCAVQRIHRDTVDRLGLAESDNLIEAWGKAHEHVAGADVNHNVPEIGMGGLHRNSARNRFKWNLKNFR